MSNLDLPPRLPGAPPQAKLQLPSFPTFRAIFALIVREMGATYGRNPGGYLWALLEPIGAIAVLTLAFSLVLHSPPLGNSFILFYATGFLPFNFYLSIGQKVQTALQASRPLLAYPRVTWVDAILARFILTALTGITAGVIIYTGILLIERDYTILDMPPILLGYTILMMTGLGIGLLNGLLIGLYPVWASIWSILNRPLFMTSGLFFTYEILPIAAQNILWWNPILQAISLVRQGFYPTYHATFVSLPYCFGFAMILIAFGLLFLRKWYQITFER